MFYFRTLLNYRSFIVFLYRENGQLKKFKITSYGKLRFLFINIAEFSVLRGLFIFIS